MKRLILLTLVAFFAISAATAYADINIYNKNSTKFATYGKLQLDIENFDGENKYKNNGSRLGFKSERQLKHGLTGFARLEVRYDASHKSVIGTNDEAKLDIRNTYLGIKGGLGKIIIGNFDSIIEQLITGQADIMESYGWRPLISGGTHARGNSLAYTLPEIITNLTLALAVKHYSGNKVEEAKITSANGNQQFNFQLATHYQLTPSFSLGLGVDQNNKRAEAIWANEQQDTDPIYAFSALYETKVFHLGLTAEKTDNLKAANFTAGVGYNAGKVYLISAWQDNSKHSGLDFALGINYELEKNFWLYGELALGNDKNSALRKQIATDKYTGTQAVTLGVAYKW